MNNVKCPICSNKCVKNGKNKSGTQRWKCSKCKLVFVKKNDNSAKTLNSFLDWLFSKLTQNDMPGRGRTFRRKTKQFWDIWPMAPKIEEQRDIVYADGIYIARNVCILICCDDKHVLGWYLCRYECSRAWKVLMKRIAQPKVVISDGGTGFNKALKSEWPNTKHQRCIFHVFCQIRRYTTTKSKTRAGAELYKIAKDLLKISNIDQANNWIESFKAWSARHKEFLEEESVDQYGEVRPTHERLIKAQNSIIKLYRENTLFTYLDEELSKEIKIPSTTNMIEGGVNSRLRELLRNHRGLKIDRRIKAVFWWCYKNSPNPLTAREILEIMPTDQSISQIYNKMYERNNLEGSIDKWGDAIVWGDLHKEYFKDNFWD